MDEDVPAAARSTLPDGRVLLLFFLSAPVVIVLHELGHWTVGWFYDLEPQLHAISVTCGRSASDGVSLLVSLAGPAVEFGLGTFGLLLLRHERHEAPSDPVTFWHWFLTGCSLGWLRGPKAGVQLLFHPWSDEMAVSLGFGLPGWGLPVALTLVGGAAFVFVVRLHPPGRRLVPLSLVLLAAAAGASVWAFAVGPWLLP